MFAGGALIAKQKHHESGGQNYDTVEWVTSDPVTGSEAKFYYTSEGSARSVKEIEPLGQEVFSQDPVEFPEPPPNEMVSFWEDMQWQCEVPERFYGGFWGMPIHCIKQVIQTSEFNKYIGELEPWFGSSTSFAASLESNPRNIGYGSLDDLLRDEHPHIWDDFRDASWYDDSFESLFDNVPGNENSREITFKDADSAKKALSFVTENMKDCKQKLMEVLTNLGNIQEIRSTDILKLFDNLNTQAFGAWSGFRFKKSEVEAYQEIASMGGGETKVSGGGGLSKALGKKSNRAGLRLSGGEAFMLVYIFPKSYVTSIYDRRVPASIQLMKRKRVIVKSGVRRFSSGHPV